jgi:hypothetical protein
MSSPIALERRPTLKGYELTFHGFNRQRRLAPGPWEDAAAGLDLGR